MKSKLKLAAIFGIVYILVSIADAVFVVVYSSQLTKQPYLIINLTFLITSFLAYLFFINGFRTLGIHYRERRLVEITWFSALIAFILIFFTALIPFKPELASINAIATIYVIAGILSIYIGTVFLKLKSKLGQKVVTIGRLNIISGALMVTVILSIVGVVFALIATIYEIMFLFNQSNSIEQG